MVLVRGCEMMRGRNVRDGPNGRKQLFGHTPPPAVKALLRGGAKGE